MTARSVSGPRAATARLARDRRGGITVFAAFACPVLIALSALAVDIGGVYLRTRQLQGVADAAALAAVQAGPGAADAAAAAAGWRGTLVTRCTAGAWSGTRPQATRFVPGGGAGAGVPAAACTLSGEAPLFLAAIFGRRSVSVERSATAIAPPLATLSLGSRLASVDGGIANALLSALTGSEVSLSAMDYRALAAADVDLFGFASALRGRLGGHSGTYADLFQQEVTQVEALGALADSLAAEGNGTAAAAAARIAAAAGDSEVPLDRLIDFGAAGTRDTPPGTALARVGADWLTAAILGTADGGRQVSFDLATPLGGLGATRVWLAIGERPAHNPWLTLGDDGAPTIRTAQMRLYVETQLGVAGLGQLRLPLLVELAEAEARLTGIACARADARSVGVEARPSPGRLHIAEVDRARLDQHQASIVGGPARLLASPLLGIAGEAHLATGGGDAGWQALRFTQNEIDAATVKRVATADSAQALVGSLARDLRLEVRALGVLPVDAGAVGRAVAGQLTIAAPALDELVNALTGLLGARIGEADVRVGGMRCAQPALVA